MRKRGQLALFGLFIVIISVVVWVSYPKVAGAYTGKGIPLKVSAVRDIALTLDAIYVYPYDMELEYDVDLSKFIVVISQNKIKIYDASSVSLDASNQIQGKDKTFSQYSFVPVNDNPDFTFEGPKKLIFSKKEGKLIITT